MYKEAIYPVGNEDQWDVPDEIKTWKFKNPLKRSKPVDRRKVNKEEEELIDTHLKAKRSLSSENAGNVVVGDITEKHALGGIKTLDFVCYFYF